MQKRYSKEFKEKYWPNYIKDRNYAKHLNIDDIISEIKEFVSKLIKIIRTIFLSCYFYIIIDELVSFNSYKINKFQEYYSFSLS